MKIKFYRLFDRIVGTILILLLWILTIVFPKRKKTPEKILVIKLWAMGEAILTLPMISELKKAYPKAKISVLCRNRIRSVFEGQRSVDKILSAEFFPLLKLVFAFRHFHLAVDCEPYMNESALLAKYLSKKTLGFSHGLRALLYTDKTRYNDRQHVVLTYLDLLKQIEIKPKTSDKLIPLAVKKSDERAVESLLKEHRVKRSDKLVCINPGAAESAKARMWPAEKFAKVADILTKDYLVKIIIVGAKSETGVAKEVEEAMHYSPINLTGETSKRELAALLKRCRLTISNDTGTMHLSAAMQTSTIGLFGPNTPVRFAPYGKKNDFVYKPVFPKPCINVHKGKVPDCKDHNHMSKISVDDVVKKAKRLLHARNH